MKSSFCIDLQRFMLIPTKFPLTLFIGSYLVQQLAVLYPNANNSFVKQLF